eukprot:2010772-Prymnesium_polylepis.1
MKAHVTVSSAPSREVRRRLGRGGICCGASAVSKEAAIESRARNGPSAVGTADAGRRGTHGRQACVGLRAVEWRDRSPCGWRGVVGPSVQMGGEGAVEAAMVLRPETLAQWRLSRHRLSGCVIDSQGVERQPRAIIGPPAPLPTSGARCPRAVPPPTAPLGVHRAPDVDRQPAASHGPRGKLQHVAHVVPPPGSLSGRRMLAAFSSADRSSWPASRNTSTVLLNGAAGCTRGSGAHDVAAPHGAHAARWASTAARLSRSSEGSGGAAARYASIAPARSRTRVRSAACERVSCDGHGARALSSSGAAAGPPMAWRP